MLRLPPGPGSGGCTGSTRETAVRLTGGGGGSAPQARETTPGHGGIKVRSPRVRGIMTENKYSVLRVLCDYVVVFKQVLQKREVIKKSSVKSKLCSILLKHGGELLLQFSKMPVFLLKKPFYRLVTVGGSRGKGTHPRVKMFLFSCSYR